MTDFFSSNSSSVMFELSRQFIGHSGEVRCGCYLGNGKFVTGGLDAACLVWDWSSGESSPIKSLFGCSDFIYSVCAHPFNADWFLAACKDKTVTIFDSVSGEKVMVLETSRIHTGPTCSVAAAGTIAAVGSWDGSFSVWNLESGELIYHKKQAGAFAVTVAIAESLSCIVTGSQDKALKFWSLMDGSLLREIPNAHSDIIRSIVCTTGLVATASNDTTCKIWSYSSCVDDLSLVGSLAGAHDNFIFSVDVLPERNLVVSAGEDRSVRLWSLEDLSLVQTIMFPGTVWFAKGNSHRFFAGCSDGILRVFSTIDSEVASLIDRENFSASVAAAVASEDQDQVDPATVIPETDMARVHGRKVGEIKMFKDLSNTVFAYQWSATGSWEKVGLVTGGSSRKPKKTYGGDQFFPAGDYQYIFDVEIGQDRMALLPFSDGDNPLVAAEKFCAREGINKANISQIIDFLKVNVPSLSSTLAGAAVASTGGSSTSNHFPLLTPFIFREAKWGPLQAKLHDVNDQLPIHCRLDAIELSTLDHVVELLQKPPSHASPDLRAIDISVVHSSLISKFPPEALFVVFDLWRLFVLNSAACVMYKDSDSGGQYLTTAARALATNASNNTGLCAARFFANLFSQSVSKWAAVDRHSLYLPFVLSAIPQASKGTQIACASVTANLASATAEKSTAPIVEIAQKITNQLCGLLSENANQQLDPDALYRLLVALGCAVCGSRGTLSPQVRDQVRLVATSCLDSSTRSDISECANDIIRSL